MVGMLGKYCVKMTQRALSGLPAITRNLLEIWKKFEVFHIPMKHSSRSFSFENNLTLRLGPQLDNSQP